MNFWIIHAQENPAEARNILSRREWRSNTICEVLADRSHSVVRWRSSFSHQKKAQLVEGSVFEKKENYFQQFIDTSTYKKHVGLARIRSHYLLGENFTKLAKSHSIQPDLIHVGNVPIELCSAAVDFGKNNKIPVIIDIRDLWPDTYLDFLPDQVDLLRPLVGRLLDATSFKLKRSFRDATAFTALTESYLEWALAKVRRTRSESDQFFSMCYPLLDTDSLHSETLAIREKFNLSDGDIIASYIGNIGYQSDFNTLIDAARKLKSNHKNFKILLVGGGPEVKSLEKKSSDLENIIFTGWLDSGELQALINLSDIGFIAYKPVKNYLLTVPNKFSEYSAGGMAIACGLEGEMANLVRDHECGFVYGSNDVNDLVQKLNYVLSDPSALKAMQKKALLMHTLKFDGKKVYPKIANYLENQAKLGKVNTRPVES